MRQHPTRIFGQPLPADQKALLIRHSNIFRCHGIITSYNQIITHIAVSAGSAADQGPMDLADPEEVAVAQKRKYMEKSVLFGKFCVGTLCEAVACCMMLLIIGGIHIDKPFRIFEYIFPIPVPGPPEYFIDQPHMGRAVQIK